MTDDILDTRFEGKKVELSDNKVELGEDINLLAKDPALRRILVGMGWDLNAFDADTLDLDVSVFLIGKDEKTREDADFVFYNQMQTCGGAVSHNGDSRTGAGDGDDESISINLEGVPFDVMRLVIALTIYKGEEKDQGMGQVRNAYIRLVNEENMHEILRFELDELLEGHQETGMIVGQINREGPKWHFVPKADFVQGGLKPIAEEFGMIITGQ